MDESLKLLTKSDLRKGFKIYLQNNDYSKNSISTFSSQALFLYDRLGADKFWEILQSNDDEFENIARKSIYNELSKNRSQKNTNGYLSNLRCFRQYCGISSNYKNKKSYKNNTSITIENKTKKYECNLNIEDAIDAIKKYHYSIDGEYTRYKSWEHCYNAFKKYRHDEEKTEFLCMHLSCFMASWGMLRGSKLIEYDYFIHKDFVTEISNSKYDRLYNDSFENNDLINELVDLINKLYLRKISKKAMITEYDRLSDTFVTKILLGVFGCVPAYDRYFKSAVSYYKVCSQNFNEHTLIDLYSFYNLYFEEFENLRKQFANEGVYYTPMKLIDMCFWQLGVDLENKG
ncbi:MAG: hypothetical protein ACI4HO_05140 [Ruminococcus sp.]